MRLMITLPVSYTHLDVYKRQVQDDKAMDDLVGTIKEHGIMTPATVRPEKDGKGYEIIAGHRRCHGGERAGLDEIPCIVREMTDLEAVREMKNSNKQRGDPLPSELAKLLDLELEAIKRQGDVYKRQWTEWSDVENSVNVLLHTILKLDKK